jgi:hypothetical protein
MVAEISTSLSVDINLPITQVIKAHTESLKGRYKLFKWPAIYLRLNY